jgi:hypothetical protein
MRVFRQSGVGQRRRGHYHGDMLGGVWNRL